MKSARSWLLAGAVVVSVGFGCSPPPPADGGGAGDTGTTPGDSMMMTDATTTDARDARVDTGPRDVPRPDSGPPNEPCAAAAIVDLTTVMPGADGVVHYMGNNNTVGKEGGLPTPMGCPLNNMAMDQYKGAQVALRYRMRTGGVLRASTDNAGTDREFDTVLMITNACSATGMPYGCNDDIAGTNPRSTVTTTALAMGTEVFIVVGGYTPALLEGTSNRGTYELTLTESAPIAIGSPCTAMDVCAPGSACIPNPGSMTMGTCTADGAGGGLCRLAAPFCDGTLTCSVAAPTAMMRGTCRASVALGGACDPAGRANSCTAPALCGLTSATAGECQTATAEVEPNNTPAAPQTPALTMGHVVVSGAMPAGDMQDCYAVAVGAMGSLVVQTNNGAGGCPAMTDTIVQVFNPAGMMIAMNDDGFAGLCSYLDGTTTGPVHALAAGNYAVCVTSYMDMPITGYTLNIAVLP